MVRVSLPQPENGSDSGNIDYNPRQLEVDRNRNDHKFKSRLEHIFSKYEHDFEGVGDEIDLVTSKIVVNNGHLEHMQNEVDTGKGASSLFARAFQDELEHEDEEDDESLDEDHAQAGAESQDEGLARDRGMHDVVQDEALHSSGVDEMPTISTRPPNLICPVAAPERPIPRLAQLLGVSKTPSRASQTHLTGEPPSSAVTSSGLATPLLERVPGLQQSLRAMHPHTGRRSVDPAAIKALGVSIASQLAQYMPGSSKGKKKTDNGRLKLAPGVSEPAWAYPELPAAATMKRARTASPIHAPADSSPPPGAAGEESLWTAEGVVRPRKRRRTKAEMLDGTPAGTMSLAYRPPASRSSVQSAELRRCWNCSLTRTTKWSEGPHGQDLCDSCGRYFEHFRRMKPFDSPTPEPEAVPIRPSLPTPRSSQHDDLVTISGVHTQGDTGSISNDHRSSPPILPVATREDVMNTQMGALGSEIFDMNKVEESLATDLGLQLKLSVRETISSDSGPVVINRHDVAVEQSEDAPATSDSPTRLLHAKNQGHSPAESQGYAAPDDDYYTGYEVSPDRQFDRLTNPLLRHESMQSCASQDLTTDARPAKTTSPTLQHLEDFPGPFQTIETMELPDTPYTTEEDAIIIKLRERAKLSWSTIASYLPGRTGGSLEDRYNQALRDLPSAARDALDHQESHAQTTPDESGKPVLRKDSAWNNSLDELLLELREEQDWEWEDIAAILPRKSPDTVERRYELLIDAAAYTSRMEAHVPEADQASTLRDIPSRRHPHFTAEEDALLVRLREVESLEWPVIAQRMPHRPLHLIQTRYACRLGPDVRKNIPTTKYDAVCGTIEDRIFAVDPELAGAVPFTPDEDSLIQHLRDHEDLGWEDIAMRCRDRTSDAVRHRHEYITGSCASTRGLKAVKSASNPGTTTSSPMKQHKRKRRSTMVPHKDEQSSICDEIAQQLPGRSADSTTARHSAILSNTRSNSGDTIEQSDMDCSRTADAATTTSTEVPIVVPLLQQSLAKDAVGFEQDYDGVWSTASSPEPLLDIYENKLPGEVSTHEASSPQVRAKNKRRAVAIEIVSGAHNDDLQTPPAEVDLPERARRRPYTSKEEEAIVKLRDERSMTWAEIADQLPGRSPSSIAGHYSTKLKKKSNKASPFRKAMCNSSQQFPADAAVSERNRKAPATDDEFDYSMIDDVFNDAEAFAPSQQLFREMGASADEHQTMPERHDSGMQSLMSGQDADVVVEDVALSSPDQETSRQAQRISKRTRKRASDQSARDSIVDPIDCSVNVSGALSALSKRPKQSYFELIESAYAAHDYRPLTVKEIFEWILSKYSYYRKLKDSPLRSCIRAVLSARSEFERVDFENSTKAWRFNGPKRANVGYPKPSRRSRKSTLGLESADGDPMDVSVYIEEEDELASPESTAVRKSLSGQHATPRTSSPVPIFVMSTKKAVKRKSNARSSLGDGTSVREVDPGMDELAR